LPINRPNFQYKWLWITLLSSLALRLAWMLYADPIPVSDFAGYRTLAETLIDFQQFGYPAPSAYRLPGYPAFLAALMLVNRSLTWLQLGNVLLSTALIPITYIFANKITTNRQIATLAAALVGFNPTYIFFAPILASEHLFTFLLCGCYILVMSRWIPSPWSEVLAGAAFGALALTRGEGLFYLPVILFAGYAFRPTKAHPILRLAAFCTAGFIVIFPWYLRNQAVIGPGTGLSTSGGLMFYYGHHDTAQDWAELQDEHFAGLPEGERSQKGYRLGLEYMSQAGLAKNLGDVAISTLKLYAPHGYPVLWSIYTPRTSPDVPFPERSLAGKNLFIFIVIAGYAILALLAAWSLVYFKRYPWQMWSLLLGSIAANWLCYGALFAGTSRYRYPIEVMLCTLASIALWELQMKRIGARTTTDMNGLTLKKVNHETH
jgi:hypothetical protein